MNWHHWYWWIWPVQGAALVVPIALAVRYARRHPKAPPELAVYGHTRLPRLPSKS